MNKKQYTRPAICIKPNRIKFYMLSESIPTPKSFPSGKDTGAKQGISAHSFANERGFGFDSGFDDGDSAGESIWNF